MKDGYLKKALTLLGVRAVFVLIAVVFLFSFAKVLELKYGVLIYSALVSVFYLLWVFNFSLDEGGKDFRAKRVKTDAGGFLYGIMSECVGIALLVAVFFGMPSYIYIIWNAPFAGFIRPEGGFLNVAVSPMFFVVLFIVPVVSGIAYSIGVRKAKKISDKLHNKA